MSHRILGVLAALLLGVAPRAAHAFEAKAPRLTRAQMEAQLEGGGAFLFVYGTQKLESTAPLRERATLLARRLFGADSTAVVADRDAAESTLVRRSFVLVGGPTENLWTRRIAVSLPVAFTAKGFRWFGRTYEGDGEVLHLVFPSPLDPRRFVLLLAANSPAGLTRRGAGLVFGDDDWRIERDGELVRRGRFAQGSPPWTFDPALDHDRDRDREKFAESLREVAPLSLTPRGARVPRPISANALTVVAPVGLGDVEFIREGALLARLDAMGLRDPMGLRRATLTLYHSIEEKGIVSRNTRPEHLAADGSAHAALPTGRKTFDLWSVAAQRLLRLGAAGDSPFLEPAGVWLSGSLEGEPLAAAVRRLYYARLLPTAESAARTGGEWRSPLIDTPARALLVRAMFEVAGSRGPRALRALLATPAPGTLDSLCRRAGVDAGATARRYAALGDSLARAGRAGLASSRIRAWRPTDGFMRGVALAHSPSLEGGYASAACGRELARLRKLGPNWVSLTPFAYLPSPNQPDLLMAGRGIDDETDEALCEAAARAHALGMRVWLSPQISTRGWVGRLDFPGGGWARFFEQYRAMVLHYALLAEREGIDGLFVGHELTSAALGSPDRFRALIGEVRACYDGTLSYAAHGQREAEGIAFWDALDVMAVTFDDPLADAQGVDSRVMATTASKTLASLRVVAQRTGRPLLLAELGYPSTSGAAATPWDDARSGPFDAEAQRACTEAAVRALDPADWVAGAFWRKWYTSGEQGGIADRSFSPRGKPAEAVIAGALQSWESRPVRVLSAQTK